MNEDKNIKTYSLIGAVCSIICSIYFFVRPFSYGATISIYYMVLCVLPYIMIAVLLLLRKKHMMWLIPSGIWLYQTFRQWHWFLFDDTLDCAVAICLILAQASQGAGIQDSSGKIRFSDYTRTELPLRGVFISENGCKGNTRK